MLPILSLFVLVVYMSACMQVQDSSCRSLNIFAVDLGPRAPVIWDWGHVVVVLTTIVGVSLLCSYCIHVTLMCITCYCKSRG